MEKNIFLFLFLTFFISVSQDTISNSFLLNPVVLTGQYTPLHIDSSFYSVDILQVDDQNLFGAQNLSSVLKRQIGIDIFQDPFLGSYIDFQGFTGENIKILIDGIEIVGLKNGIIDFSQINLNNIDKIEIVDGPLSTVYGNNALGATINLISKTTQDKKIKFSFETYLESIGQYNININTGYKFKNDILSVSLGRHYFDGWSKDDELNLFQSFVPADSSRFQEWKPKEQWFLKSNYSYKTKKNLLFKPYIDLFKEEVINKGFPNGVFTDYAFDEYYFTNKFDKGLVIKGPFLDRNIDVIIRHNRLSRIKNRYYIDLNNLSEVLTNDTDTTIIDEFNHRVTCSNTQNIRLNYQYGYMIDYEKINTQRVITGSQKRVETSGFFSLDYDFKAFSLRSSIRYVYNDDYKNIFTPAINLKLHTDDLYVRASYARGFRTPSLKEMYFNFVDINHNIQGNPDLESENSNNIQINLNSQFNDSFLWSVKFFYNDIDNFITLVQDDNTNNFEYLNIRGYNTTGLKARLNIDFLKSHLTFNTAYIGQSSIYNEDFDFYFTANTHLTYKINKIHDVSLFYSFKGPRDIISKNSYGELLVNNIAAYHMFDIAYKLDLFNDFMNFSIGCNNIFNIQNIDSETLLSSFHNNETTGIPLSCGRYIYTSLKFDF